MSPDCDSATQRAVPLDATKAGLLSSSIDFVLWSHSQTVHRTRRNKMISDLVLVATVAQPESLDVAGFVRPKREPAEGIRG